MSSCPKEYVDAGRGRDRTGGCKAASVQAGVALKSDAAAGLSVAAVAIPTAIAYAELAGFPPVVGL